MDSRQKEFQLVVGKNFRHLPTAPPDVGVVIKTASINEDISPLINKNTKS